jgi:NADPH-dependent ferric siderophore reductase
MPRMPKWLGDAVEKVFSGLLKEVTVTKVEYFDEHFKKVRFEGDLSKTNFYVGNVVEFRVNETDFRHYTPCHYDQEAGICDVLFYLHSLGLGSDWAEGLKKNDTMKLLGPAGKIRLDEQARQHLVFGDETSLGLMQFFQSAVRPEQNLEIIAEVNDRFQYSLDTLGIVAQIAKKSHENPAGDAIRIWESIYCDEWKDATFYLTGRAKSIQSFRKALQSKGISNKQIMCEPYWADGKTGL